MARITRAAPHLSAEELKTRWQLDRRPWCRQRWLILYNALVDPREATDIAKHTGTTVAMVHQVISSYNRLGVAAVETSGKGGRRHQYVTWEAEQAFLAPFFTRAERGEIATAREIKHAFEAQVGHEVHKSTISRLLKRHGWRKAMPRPVHPQASAEAQALFKKTSPPPLRQPSLRARQMTSDPS
jgi:transposase